MKKEQRQIKKEFSRVANFVSADIFEEACQLVSQNWRYCIEIDLILLLVLSLGSGLLLGLWKLAVPKMVLLVAALMIIIFFSMIVVGKNKNFGGLVRGMASGRYPLWAGEYFFSGLKWLLTKFLLLGPIVLGLALAIFYLFISPSSFWLWLCVLSCLWWEGWLILRFNLTAVIVSLKNEFSFEKSRQLSWKRTTGKAQKLVPWLIFNGLIFAPLVIFLPVVGWFWASAVISFEWLIINQRLYENKL